MCYGRADGNRLQRTIVAAGKQHNSHGEKNAGKRGRPEPHGTLLSRPKNIWSGRRDLNPRLRPWQGRTLPLSYSRSVRPFDTISLSSGQRGASLKASIGNIATKEEKGNRREEWFGGVHDGD